MCGVRGPKTDSVDGEIIISFVHSVAKVVWEFRVGPKRVVDGTMEFLRYFLLAAVLFMPSPVFFLACPEQCWIHRRGK